MAKSTDGDDDPLLLYDGECSLCRSLAAWVQMRAGIGIRAWQDHYGPGAGRDAVLENYTVPRLEVLTGGTVLPGPAAWSWLLENFQALKPLGWAAARLGLQEQAARGLERAAGWVRSWCRTCPPR